MSSVSFEIVTASRTADSGIELYLVQAPNTTDITVTLSDATGNDGQHFIFKRKDTIAECTVSLIGFDIDQTIDGLTSFDLAILSSRVDLVARDGVWLTY